MCLFHVQGGGFRAFWRGNGANVAKVIPESSVKFFANDFFKKRIVADPDAVRVYERLVAGSLAGVTAQSMIYPLEVVKTRIAIAKPGTATSTLLKDFGHYRVPLFLRALHHVTLSVR